MSGERSSNEAYRGAVQFLYGLRLFGAKFGLENTIRLAALAGNPHQKLRFIHVAGTNGKGSTCAMLESIYRATGLRVGLFTSPHLVSFRERIQVNRQLIDEMEVVRLLDEMRPWFAQFAEGHHPTFFEAVTVMALRYFAEQKCDLVIWETGLGGRLDATNIVTPLASVITNISLDHSEWLGDTVEKIAAEKAGIIKPGVPVITGALAGAGLDVIARMARENQAPLTVVTATDTERPPLNTMELPLHGLHQRLNAAIAVAVTRVLGDRLPLAGEALRHGLGAVVWPGRLQRFEPAPGRVILLDGAHNPAGAEALRLALETDFPGVEPALIFGVFRDKDSASMCRTLAPLAGRLVLVPIHTERTEDPVRLVDACRAANPHAPIEILPSLADAQAATAGEPLVVIAGSLYLVGEALELLHLSAAPPDDEKRLNEWKTKTT
jgi:dihydrofolate synthase / folylpolyglutamate synthase